jgi:hypothetical protein
MLDSIRITARDAAIILLVVENLVVSAGVLFLLVKGAGFLRRAKPKTRDIIRKAAAIATRVNQVVNNISDRMVTPIAQFHGLKVGLRAGLRRIILGRRKEAPGV